MHTSSYDRPRLYRGCRVGDGSYAYLLGLGTSMVRAQAHSRFRSHLCGGARGGGSGLGGRMAAVLEHGVEGLV